MKTNHITVGAYQGHAVYGDIANTMQTIRNVIDWAQKEKVDILCFPECFLQGYFLESAAAHKASIDVGSTQFREILNALYSDSVTIILGLIEKRENNIFNTAVVIEKGELIGTYSKQHLLNKEAHFTKGSGEPVFQKNGVRFGINICYDTRFPESSKAMVSNGAQILFYLINNSLPHATADKWKDAHVPYWKQRASENSCWVMTADVIEESQTNTGYGFTTLINPHGDVVESLPHLKPGHIKHSITLT